MRGLEVFEAGGCAWEGEGWVAGKAHEAEFCGDVGVFVGAGEGVPGILEGV